MANTYVAIATVEVGAGGAANIEFTSIPTGGTYTDLILLYSIRCNRNDYADTMTVRLNGNTGSVYSYIRLVSYNGTSVGSFSGTNGSTTSVGAINASTSTASTFSNGQIYLPNYTSSSNKSASLDGVTENNSANNFCEMDAYLASITSAITSITLLPTLGTSFDQYSTAYLYGIKNS